MALTFAPNPAPARSRYSPVSAFGTFIGTTVYRNWMPLQATIDSWRHTDPPITLSDYVGAEGTLKHAYHFAIVLYYACRATRPYMEGFIQNRVTNPHGNSIAEMYLRWALAVTNHATTPGISLGRWVPADPPPTSLHAALWTPSPPWLGAKDWQDRSPDIRR